MRCLAQILGIEGGAKAEGDPRAELNVVSESCNTTIVDLGLFHVLAGNSSNDGSLAHLCKRAGIKLVFAGDLQTDVVAGFGVPSGLGASFYFLVDQVVVARGEDA